MFYQTLGPLNHHLRHTFVVFRKLVKGRIDNLHIFSFNSLLNVRNLLRALVNEKDNQVHIGILGGDRFCNLL